jgi:hypothetical protein
MQFDSHRPLKPRPKNLPAGKGELETQSTQSRVVFRTAPELPVDICDLIP